MQQLLDMMQLFNYDDLEHTKLSYNIRAPDKSA